MYFTGAIAISRLLMINHSIQLLWIGYNFISDDGIAAIATALTNSSISELEVIRCGITLTGATSLATFLLANQSIRKLWLAGNPITTDGAHLILQSAINNKLSQVPMIATDDEYCKDSEVQMLYNILNDRRKMKQ